MLHEWAKGLAYSKLPHDLPLNMDSDSLFRLSWTSHRWVDGSSTNKCFQIEDNDRSPSKLASKYGKGMKTVQPFWQAVECRSANTCV